MNFCLILTLLPSNLSSFRNVISTWSSGTGGAGIAGAVSYAALTAIGLSSKHTLLVMICVPVLEGVVFWGLLRHPKGRIAPLRTEHDDTPKKLSSDAENYSSNEEKPLITLMDKVRYMPHLLKYMIPLSLVYLFEYFINQGLVS
jgi:battenin